MSTVHLYVFHLEHGASNKFGGGNFGQSVIGYYRLGQAYPRSKLRQSYVDKRKHRPWHSRFFQIVDFTQTVNQTLTFTDQATATQALNQEVEQELLFNQAATTTLFNNVSQTLTFVNQVSAAGSTFNQSVSQTLTFNQTATAIVDHIVLQTLVFAQTATGVNVHTTSQTLIFFDVVANNHDSNLLTGDALNFLDSASFNIDQVETVSQTLVFVQTAESDKEHSETVNQTIIFAQQAAAVKQVFVSQTLTFVDQAQFDLDKFRTVEQTLVFNQTVNLNADFSRTIVDILTFVNGRELDTGLVDGNGEPIIEFINGAQAVVVHDCFVLLKAPSRVIILPCPLFGDSEALSVEMNLERTITGATYTYVKTSEMRLYSYTFELTRDKARELKDFLLINNSVVMVLQDWKGQQIKGNITNNPFEFTMRSRWATCAEKVEITIEFEGVKIAG